MNTTDIIAHDVALDEMLRHEMEHRERLLAALRRSDNIIASLEADKSARFVSGSHVEPAVVDLDDFDAPVTDDQLPPAFVQQRKAA